MEYTETTNLIQNGNRNRRKVYIREILFYTAICSCVIIYFVLLLFNLLSTENISRKQMRPVDLQKVDRVNSKFANWTKEQLETLLTSSSQLKTCKPVLSNSTMSHNDGLPNSVDWRKKGVIGDVIDQRFCNICWEVSIVQVMESMVAIRRNAHHVTPLSIQEMIDCSYGANCEPGDPRVALEHMRDVHMSIVPEKEYPLTLKAEDCRYKHIPYPKGVMIKDYHVACDVNEEYIMSLIYHHGPVIAAVDPDRWIYYTDGIISENCPSYMPKHVVQIVGYDRTGDIPFYIIKNSWGTDFGDNGYIYIKMGQRLCGIEHYITSLDVEY